MIQLFCATTNPGKVVEFRRALEDAADLAPLPNLSALATPEETGTTFEENAALKAVYYSRFCSGLLFAEDSGLAVDALDGAPGIYSARYAGPAASDEDNNRLLLTRMQGQQERRARFIAVAALARDGQLLGTYRGEVEGLLLDAPRGTNGFGYDPLFFYPPFACSFGEAPLAAKLRVSHRTRALTAMINDLHAGAANGSNPP